MKYIIALLVSCRVASADPTTDPRVVWTRPDGAVDVVSVVWSKQLSIMTTDALLEIIRIKSGIPDGSTYEFMPLSAIPRAQRYFRGAWTRRAGAFTVDRAKAEAIHKRALQDRALTEFQREPTKRDEALRSIEAMDLTTPATLDDLKAVAPDVLKPKK